MKKKLVAVLVGVMCLGAAVACNGTVEDVAEGEVGMVEEAVAEEAADVAEEVVEEVEEVVEEDEMPTAEEEYEAVKATLTFMGALKSADEASDMQLAIFRNADGDILTVIYKDGSVCDYGFAENEEAETEDGEAYTKVLIDEKEFGYTFGEDLTTGLLVDEDGTVYDAVELSEDDAFLLVRSTIVIE